MPLIQRISLISTGLLSRWADYGQSEKLSYLIVRITNRQHLFQIADLTIGPGMARDGLNGYSIL